MTNYILTLGEADRNYVYRLYIEHLGPLRVEGLELRV
jgi:hypothetical protein